MEEFVNSRQTLADEMAIWFYIVKLKKYPENVYKKRDLFYYFPFNWSDFWKVKITNLINLTA